MHTNIETEICSNNQSIKTIETAKKSNYMMFILVDIPYSNQLSWLHYSNNRTSLLGINNAELKWHANKL